MPIIFKNPGVIDPRAIKIFGVSSKDNPSAIGFFGTGLKYAVSILLRNDCAIRIVSGGETYEFGTVEATIRNDNFSVVTMNGEELGFTTHVGAKWELWMAYRELWANAMDEGGEVFETGSFYHPEPHTTSIIVTGEAFEKVYEDRAQYILESTPIETVGKVEIHPGGNTHNIYFKKMLVSSSKKPYLNKYNINSHLDLTEDRTAKWGFELIGHIARTVVNSTNSDMIRRALTHEDFIEFNLDYGVNEPGETFLTVATELAKDRGQKMNMSAYRMVRERNRDKLTPNSMVLSPFQSKMLSRAASFCAAIGYDTSEYETIITDDLGDGIMGLAENGRIYLSLRTFDMGTKFLASTLLEEYIHLKFRHLDYTLEMQNFLFEKLVSLAEEHVWKEPL